MVEFADTFNAAEAAAGFLSTTLGVQARWKPTPAPNPAEGVRLQCLTCGNVVTLGVGEVIPHGDPRLCSHATDKSLDG